MKDPKQTCCNCGKEFSTQTYVDGWVQSYDPVKQKLRPMRKKKLPEKETVTIEVVHKRDFHHTKGYIWETWTGAICPDCFQNLSKVLPFLEKLRYWID